VKKVVITPPEPLPEKPHPRLRYWEWWMPLFGLAWLAVYASVFPEPAALASRHWPLVLVGFVGALIGNATSIGGGLVFVPVMMIFYDLDPVASLQLALATQAFGMTSGAIAWMRRGMVPKELLPVSAIAAVAGGAVAALVIKPSAFLVKELFGPVSIGLGILILVLLDRPAHLDRIPPRPLRLLALVAFAGGMLTGWVAIGAGEVVAAFLMLAYGLRAERSIALGVVLLSVCSIVLTLFHAFAIGGIPWEMAVFTILGCVYGARTGPCVAQWIGPRRLKIGFAAVAILDGLLFLFQGLTAHSG